MFGDEDENKFSHTEVHAEFKSMIEGLINQHLSEIGVSEENFYAACENAMQGGKASYADKVIEQEVYQNEGGQWTHVDYQGAPPATALQPRASPPPAPTSGERTLRRPGYQSISRNDP